MLWHGEQDRAFGYREYPAASCFFNGLSTPNAQTGFAIRVPQVFDGERRPQPGCAQGQPSMPPDFASFGASMSPRFRSFRALNCCQSLRPSLGQNDEHAGSDSWVGQESLPCASLSTICLATDRQAWFELTAPDSALDLKKILRSASATSDSSFH